MPVVRVGERRGMAETERAVRKEKAGSGFPNLRLLSDYCLCYSSFNSFKTLILRLSA